MCARLFVGLRGVGQPDGVDMAVWMDSWQTDCCSTPLTVGSQVSWTAGEDDSDWLSAIPWANAQM
jgi:hypothetical protein